MKAGAKLKSERLRQKIRRVKKESRGLAGLFKYVRRDFVTEQRRHFTGETGPDGPWPKRAQESERRSLNEANKSAAQRGKRARKRAPKMLGKLRTKIKYRVKKNGIFAESKIPWSGVHQTGGTVGRGAKIPARPFLYTTKPWRRMAVAKMLRRMFARFAWGR